MLEIFLLVSGCALSLSVAVLILAMASKIHNLE
jgi:hypothetical protein